MFEAACLDETDLPAVVLARMLGARTAIAVAWQRARNRTGAADVQGRVESCR